ncbi:MAG TPA: hypothetical protein VMF57_12985 [Solirubrobacteraceae bacterium]|nr:hypothetical protein [Solirubrobacteraceae bacterium]
MRFDDATTQLLLAVARWIERDGLVPDALDALEEAHVLLTIEWHPTLVDYWRSTVSAGGRVAPLVVDRDASAAAVIALRAAVIHGVRRQQPDRPLGATALTA